jgi:hypothetical protein
MLDDTDSGFVMIHCDRCLKTGDVRVKHGWALLCARCRREDDAEWQEESPE